MKLVLHHAGREYLVSDDDLLCRTANDDSGDLQDDLIGGLWLAYQRALEDAVGEEVEAIL